MNRLVVVSNRVADLEKTGQSGGLAVALGDALREHGGLWFGWNGDIAPEGEAPRLSTQSFGDTTVATTTLTQSEVDDYYNGMANSVLWPILHYRLDLAHLDAGYLQAYRKVNERFADELCKLLKPDDRIWIHDYHLFPLGAELRARGIGNAIGFFLHVPFPPPDMFIALPGHDWLIRSIFSYDVIGFQTAADLHNFQHYVIENFDGECHDDVHVTAFGRTITAKVFPIGIDVDAFKAMAETDEARGIIKQMQRRSVPVIQIIGVDRLDYSKGLPERFKAFRMLLEQSPSSRSKVTLMQIAPPTRENVDAYAEIREELEQLSGAINGAFADFNWTPIRYLHRAIPRATLAALYRGSKVGLVTPLRDGMNLVAKEYVAAQDPDDPGVLVLSIFAGAAEEMAEALQVNPHDIQDVTNAILRAISMPLEERLERHRALMHRIRKHDVVQWRHGFVGELEAAAEQDAR